METIAFPLYLSLKVAALATFVALLIGIVCAWMFVQWQNRWTKILSLITVIPLVLPPTVLGYYLLLVIGRDGLVGRIIEHWTGSPIVFTWKAAVIAAAIASLPLIIRPIQTAFESIEHEILKAAQLDGANRWQVFRYIMLPLGYRGVLAGLVLGFARAMGEFGATLMVAGNIPGQTQTLAIAIYDAVQANRMTEAHLMAVVLSGTTLLLLFIVTQVVKQNV
ncbi:molybdenum ABC transporter permease subunit [Caldalkalibacillus thermarum]|uniref:molybdate ABC transporter permease subunit n=1 Tax=Caldalkalibacillus thermarum TaxID=296745 RepID=UPI001668A726|nr:molybdate ABC transporter permease subunit [Caldalkalibacillus thermarum]GGK33601.1 molybdenum ABC transporter permease subunit [Caldalkalibacillus thermarum]